LMTSMKLLADGGFAAFDSNEYDTIPNNSSGRIMNFVFRNATLIDRTKPDQLVTTTADIGVNLERRRAEQLQPTTIRQVGQVTLAGLEEFDASEFNVTGRFQPLRVGNYGEMLFYKKGREVNWASPDIEKEFPPDAIFSLGKWVRGEGLLKRRN